MSPEKPGSIPFTYIVVFPLTHAASNGSRNHASACGGYTSHTSDVLTTFVPAARNAISSRSASPGRVSACDVYTTQSAPSATSASTSSVATIPVASSRPHSAAASRPTLLGLLACTPTSSRSGRSMRARRAWRPTLPVENWITRYDMFMV
jgi:hypothetical protein